MKTIPCIATLFAAFLITTMYGQDHQKWYADDIYYDVTEKEISYFEINFISLYETEHETAEESFNVNTSYASRINRLHRDYYGTSLSFNYGYFHDPYHQDLWGYHNYRYDPFYDYGWSSLNYGWNAPYNNYVWHKSWNHPWTHGYGYDFWYHPNGYGQNHYKYNAASKNLHYGPRENLNSNVSGENNRSYSTRRINSSRQSNQNSLRNSERRTYKQEEPSRNDRRFEGSNTNKRTVTKENPSTGIRPERSTYSKPNKSKSGKNISEWLKKEIGTISNSKETNTGNTPTYRPSRSSNPGNSGNTRTNKSSSNTRKSR
jgi:hypothetical protein